MIHVFRVFDCFKVQVFLFGLLVASLFVFSSPTKAFATQEAHYLLSDGGYFYVPAYPHIYHGSREAFITLHVALSFRNVDMGSQIVIDSVEYYDNDGVLLKEFVDDPIVLKPLESVHFKVPERDLGGGFGSNFIVSWHAEHDVNMPIVESVMIGTSLGQGISFTSRGVVIRP